MYFGFFCEIFLSNYLYSRALEFFPVISMVRVARSLVFFGIVICKSLFVLLSFLGHCVVLSFDLRFLITLWYLQTQTQWHILIYYVVLLVCECYRLFMVRN
jgi:hypothetical protein